MKNLELLRIFHLTEHMGSEGRSQASADPLLLNFTTTNKESSYERQPKKRNEALKAENQRVGVQQTKQVLQKRSQLYPIMDRE